MDRLRRLTAATLLALGLGAVSSPSEAARLTSSPDTLNQTLSRAAGGDIITLSAGEYGEVTIAKRHWQPAVTLDASAAHFRRILIQETSGLSLVGGQVDALPGPGTSALKVNRSQDVSVSRMRLSGAHAGLVIYASARVRATFLDLTRLVSDGIDIGLSQMVLVDSNTCTDFRPTKSTYDAQGKRLVDGDHPDCVQGFSRPDAPPTSDVTVTHNRADGDMQGISFFNHARNGVDDGGFDRILIADNFVRSDRTQGIALADARDSRVVRNRIETLPGATIPQTGQPVKPRLRIFRGRNVVACDNSLPDYPTDPAARRC